MSDIGKPAAELALLERMKLARSASAVLKAKLITLRSVVPNGLVFVFEGDEDKIVYGQWVRRVRPEMRYEPFPCNGKKGVRDLKNSVVRDLAGLGERVFFFVDRDFDDLDGFIDSASVFMTETYSIENCLVAGEVLDELLRDEFPCHAMPDLRRKIVQLFNDDYDVFLASTVELNSRIYCARRIPIRIIERLPSKLSCLVEVQIGGITASATPAGELVVLEREPTADELLSFSGDFAALDPRVRFRGKFALKFFEKWLGRLADHWGACGSSFFGDDLPRGGVRRAEFVLSNFATKSKIPIGLASFICAIE